MGIVLDLKGGRKSLFKWVREVLPFLWLILYGGCRIRMGCFIVEWLVQVHDSKEALSLALLYTSWIEHKFCHAHHSVLYFATCQHFTHVMTDDFSEPHHSKFTSNTCLSQFMVRTLLCSKIFIWICILLPRNWRESLQSPSLDLKHSSSPTLWRSESVVPCRKLTCNLKQGGINWAKGLTYTALTSDNYIIAISTLDKSV